VLREAENFRSGLARLGIALKGVVANRVHTRWSEPSVETPDTQRLDARLQKVLPRSIEAKTIHWLVENFQTYQALAQHEARQLQQFSQRFPQAIPFVQIPALQECPVDLQGLCALHPYFFETER
jgi:hypothetical protein